MKIYIDRLKDGQHHTIEERVSHTLLAIQEQDLVCPEEILVQGEAYLAGDHLILHLWISTTAFLPCTICNQMVSCPVVIKNLHLTIPLAEISGAIFNLEEEVRQAVLLNIPQFAECTNGNCPQRASIHHLLKSTSTLIEEPSHFPFANLKS